MIIWENEHIFSSASKGKQNNGNNRFARTIKSMMTPRTVALVIQQQRPPVNISLQAAGFSDYQLTGGYQAESCPIAHLQVSLTLLERHGNNKSNLHYKRSWCSRRTRPQYYGDDINPSYRSSTRPAVTQGVTSYRTVNKA